MGGARCSYRNCTKTSDKKTHMFHYPVYDKVRCHQWITNAQKLNYLNLKLSQLKNRMVCEHHFTDDCFMNEMRKKLKNSAIPTLDGPFCAKLDKEEEANLNRLYNDIEMPINLEDIENEYMSTSERKAHLSVKYRDFLTNDITEGISLTPDYKPSLVVINDEGILFNRCDPQHSLNNQTSNNNIKLFPRATNINLSSKKAAEQARFMNNLPYPRAVSIDFDEINLPAKPDQDEPTELKLQPIKQVNKMKPANTISQTKKVRIISEKHISEPVPIPGELQPVSPSIVIQVPNKKNKCNIEVDGKEIPTMYVNKSQYCQTSKNNQSFSKTHVPKITTIEQNVNSGLFPILDQQNNNLVYQNGDALINTRPIDYLQQETYNSRHVQLDTGFMNINMSVGPNVEFVSGSSTGPSVFTLTDLPQVSTAMTETSYMEPSTQNLLLSTDSEIMSENKEQTSYVPMVDDKHETRASKNMRSSDKATSKPSSPNKAVRKMPPEKLAAIEEKRKYNIKLRDILNSCLNNMDEEPDLEKLTAAIKKESNSKKVVEHLYDDNSNKNVSLPDSQENIIAYFEARLQRMENNLLNKIEQNSQKIVDLKRVVKQPAKNSTSTQTYWSAEVMKRSLYQQMSQYLTPDTNSLIYEELFINRCVSKTTSKMGIIRGKRKYSSHDKEL